MKHGLRFRLALTHVGVALMAIAVVALIVALAGGRRFNSYTSASQRENTDAVLNAIRDAYQPGVGWTSEAVTQLGVTAVMNGVRIAVYANDGSLMFATRGGGMMGSEHGGMMNLDDESSGPEGWRTRRVPIVVNGSTVGTAVVWERPAVTLPLNSAFRRDIGVYLAAAGLAAGLASLAVGWFASRRITRPVDQLTAAAQRIASGERDVRVDTGGSDEISTLADAFNTMAESLARQEQWRRTMTADLAHELRTPLATIQARVEALEDGLLPASPENLRVIGDEVERLGRLLGTLRSLDELDSDAFALEHASVSLDGLARDAAEAAREGFARKAISLDIESNPVTVVGDVDRLRQVVANLLDNALKFTPRGGRVTVRVSRASAADSAPSFVGARASASERRASDELSEPGILTAGDGASPGGRQSGTGVHGRRTAHADWAVLEVEDSGNGIPPDELPHVFERFFRSRGAEGTEGAGLGLAIARRLVEAHGGTITAANAALGGALFTVRLPATPTT